ncbi:MAG: hypothetical protein WA056_02345 [Gallionella sp.]
MNTETMDEEIKRLQLQRLRREQKEHEWEVKRANLPRSYVLGNLLILFVAFPILVTGITIALDGTLALLISIPLLVWVMMKRSKPYR